jgi:preprotein translocase subunit SecD
MRVLTALVFAAALCGCHDRPSTKTAWSVPAKAVGWVSLRGVDLSSNASESRLNTKAKTFNSTIWVEPRTLVDSSMLTAVMAERNTNGEPSIVVMFDSRARDRVANYTRDNPKGQMAILLDGELLTTVDIHEPVTGGALVFGPLNDMTEAKRLARVMSSKVGQPMPVFPTEPDGIANATKS